MVKRGDGSLRAYFLDVVGCKTLDAFVKYAPENTLLIFDAVDRVLKHPETEVFLKYLIQLSRDSAKFKLPLCVHETKNAMALFRWVDSQRRIMLVEPAGCCLWKATCRHRPSKTSVRLWKETLMN